MSTTSIAFNSGFDVDMRDMSALFTDDVFRGFGTLKYNVASSTFTYNSNVFTVWSGTAPNAKVVMLYGSFQYFNGGVVLDTSTVSGIQVFGSQDTLTISNQRVALNFFDDAYQFDPLPLSDVFNALGHKDLSLLLPDRPLGRISGDAGADDFLIGNGRDNYVYGFAGDDTLKGGGGDDWIGGGYGKDVETGGTGADTFVFAYEPNTGLDKITDFQPGTDQLKFTAAAFTLGNSGDVLASGKFYKGANVDVTGAHDSSDRLIYDTTSGKLYYDPDGNGSKHAVLVAVLVGSPDGLKASDIEVI